ncbi:response regulator [Pseudohoeflea suaedae]|uniref:Response regulator n=1 Tax=Pseudohoeflea suaedae TaxID=877384 RepID=A0A4R5PMC7_9HYPH|nr:response regulator [Pseudohoeflea suaedae]TDH38116.1 response regulator [Pseudohoeflea suaedae]
MTDHLILYVDDEDDIREIAEMALALEPAFRVATAASGAEALERARGERPDLILLDVMMPGMDGPATLSSLRDDETTSGVPVVFITARTQAHEVERFLALGAVGVIAKPFDPMALAGEAMRYLTAGRD